MSAIAGVVFAGGCSRRMGRDKALLEFDGEPLLARVARQLAPFVEGVWISAGESARYAAFGLPVIVDERPNAGALCGLATVLATLQEITLEKPRGGPRGVLVAPCDAVDLPAGLLERLVDALLTDATLDAALCVDTDGTLQPLVGCYKPGASGRLRAAISEGERRMRAVEEILRVARVSLLPGEQLANLNTAAQLARYLGGRRGQL